MSEETTVDGLLTPLQEAAALEAEQKHKTEAETLVEDLDDYAAEVDPENLEEAEAQLREWEAPTDPLDTVTGIAPGTPLVSVFTAMTEPEANIVKGVLQAAGIPATFKLVGVSSVFGGALAFVGAAYAYVLVPEPFAEAAQAAIAEASSGSS